MFRWLEEEIRSINTPGFHVVERPAGKERDIGDLPAEGLPGAYRDFVKCFGNAKLYGLPGGGYRIGVFAKPIRADLGDGSLAYEIGFHDGARVFLKGGPRAFVVLEREGDHVEEVASSFEEWLTASSNSARKTYGKEKWDEILKGPAPFLPEEIRIVEVRRAFRWSVCGVDESGKHILRIANESRERLPFLTIGVRSRDGRLNGAVVIPVGQIAPGCSELVHVDCYSEFLSPSDVRLLELPDPRPETRDQYAEFRQA